MRAVGVAEDKALALRCKSEPDTPAALALAARDLHHKLLANFFRWLTELGLAKHWPQMPEEDLSPDDNSSFHVDDLGPLRTSRRLHEIMLFLLLHGEGANCRHCPEMLCAFFLTMALALRPPGEPAGGARALGDIEAQESWSTLSGVRGSAEARETSDTEVTSGRYPLCHAALGSRLGLPHRDYLETIVTPMYAFLSHELLGRKGELGAALK